MNSTSATIQSAGRLLSREELTSVKNLFLLNLANKDFLLGTKKRRPNVPTLVVPILIVLLVTGLLGHVLWPMIGVSVAAIGGLFRIAPADLFGLIQAL